jgi:hypothetical protein
MQSLLGMDVRWWPKCEVPTRSGNVRYWEQTGHTADITKPTHLTRSRHERLWRDTSF